MLELYKIDLMDICRFGMVSLNSRFLFNCIRVYVNWVGLGRVEVERWIYVVDKINDG